MEECSASLVRTKAVLRTWCKDSLDVCRKVIIAITKTLHTTGVSTNGGAAVTVKRVLEPYSSCRCSAMPVATAPNPPLCRSVRS